MQLSNYLFFTLQCEKALSFYAGCGLGRVTALLRHGEGAMPLHDDRWRGRLLHARFKGPGILFHVSTTTMPSRCVDRRTCWSLEARPIHAGCSNG